MNLWKAVLKLRLELKRTSQRRKFPKRRSFDRFIYTGDISGPKASLLLKIITFIDEMKH